MNYPCKFDTFKRKKNVLQLAEISCVTYIEVVVLSSSLSEKKVPREEE